LSLNALELKNKGIKTKGTFYFGLVFRKIIESLIPEGGDCVYKF